MRLTRAHPPVAFSGVAPVSMPVSAPASNVESAKPVQQDSVSPQQHPGAVKSPMVGTVYLAPEPGASPFVNVGS